MTPGEIASDGGHDICTETADTDQREFRIEETDERVNGLELELHLFFGVWTVSERTSERWVVRAAGGEQRTLVPLSD